MVRNPISKKTELVIPTDHPHAAKIIEFMVSLYNRADPEERQAAMELEHQIFSMENIAGRLSGQKINPATGKPRMLSKEELFRLSNEDLEHHFREIQDWIYPYSQAAQDNTNQTNKKALR